MEAICRALHASSPSQISGTRRHVESVPLKGKALAPLRVCEFAATIPPRSIALSSTLLEKRTVQQCCRLGDRRVGAEWGDSGEGSEGLVYRFA